MAGKNLTTAAIDRIPRPATGRKEFSDVAQGLFLRVMPTGTKSWAVVYRVARSDGKRGPREKMHLGVWPELGIEAARRTARGIAAASRLKLPRSSRGVADGHEEGRADRAGQAPRRSEDNS